MDRSVYRDEIVREPFLEALRDAQYDLEAERQAYFMRNPHMAWLASEYLAIRESDDGCGSCGADVFPSSEFVWHWPDEDCRGIKQPIAN